MDQTRLSGADLVIVHPHFIIQKSKEKLKKQQQQQRNNNNKTKENKKGKQIYEKHLDIK